MSKRNMSRTAAAAAAAVIVTTSFGPAALAGEPDTTSTAPPTSTAAGDADRIDEIEAQIQALFDELRKLRDDCPNNDTGDDEAAQAPDPGGAKSFPRGSKPDSEAAEDKADPKPEDAEDDKAAEPAAPSDGTKCAPTPPGPGSSGDAQPDGKATTKPDTGDDKKADPKQPGDAKTEPAAATAADTVVLPADGAPTDPGDKRVQSPNPSPVADADTLTGPKIRISKDDDPEAALNGKTLAAGTVVEVERGAVFNDARVVVNGNGTAAQPVLVTAVGTGPAPVFKATKAGDGKDGGIITTRGANVHLSGLALADSGSVGIRAEATGTVLNDITGTGIVIGTWVTGNGTKVWNSYWSKLRMMPDTPGPNDDYGAAGVVVEADDVTVEGVTCRDCIDVNSPDYKQYGGDGSFAEVWMKGNNLNIGWSYVDNSPRFLEAGGLGGGNSATNMKVHNSFGRIHKDAPFYFNDSGEYAGVDTSGFTETDNTVVKTG